MALGMGNKTIKALPGFLCGEAAGFCIPVVYCFRFTGAYLGTPPMFCACITLSADQSETDFSV